MSDHTFKPETLAIHAGQIPDSATGARALPIYQTSSFVFDSADHAAALFNLQTFGNVYSRLSNPTVAVLEERVAALEGGRAAVASASGMAAEAMALMTILQAGDHVVAAGALYGGSVTLLSVSLAKFGIETTFVDANQAEAFAAAIRPNTRAIYAESLGNPSMVVLDIAAVADVAHAHGLPLIIDNTVPSPFLCQPFSFGADVVVHSATKYLAGHGTTLGGVIVESGKFPWDNGKYPGMTEPSQGYHGVKFYETFGDFGFTMRCRMESLRVYGAALSPMSAWQILQGVETLPLRMERHCSNALAVAKFLQNDKRVAWVNYPGLPDHPQHQLMQQQMRGASGLLAFGVKGGLAQGVKFIEAARFMSHLVNIGDTKTLISHPASTTPKLRRRFSQHPFVPSDAQRRDEHSQEIFAIQSTGLARRLRHTGARHVVIGVSGGLDSTLALLVLLEAFGRLGLDRKGIIGITMPGPGTTVRTRMNALKLMEVLGVTAREIPIDAAVEQHLADIQHPPGKHDVTFENAQARERTQVLMDVANQVGGFVVGTGDLSEAALGWCTFNADHISMYHVNIGVPKTLVRHLVSWAAHARHVGDERHDHG